jgi:hypothetical protein
MYIVPFLLHQMMINVFRPARMPVTAGRMMHFLRVMRGPAARAP